MGKASVIVTGLALAAMGAATTLFAQEFGAQQAAGARLAYLEIGNAPVMVSGDNGGESGLPLQPQVAQILSALNNGPPSGALKRQEAAEQKLVDLGPSSADFLKRQIGSVRGAGRDVLIVATFRLENAPLSPRQSIGEWASKKAGVDPAAVILHHFSAEDLRHLFPHHLFYVAEKKADASGKNALTRTLVALAGDGKVQPLDDDAALGHFLKVELAGSTGKVEERRVAAAAAELALARQSIPSGEIVSNAKLTDGGATGTARCAAANASSVSVAVTFSHEGKVAGITTTVVAPVQSAAPVTGAPAPTPEAATAAVPATEMAPASRPVRRFHPHPPIMRGGPQNEPMLRN